MCYTDTQKLRSFLSWRFYKERKLLLLHSMALKKHGMKFLPDLAETFRETEHNFKSPKIVRKLNFKVVKLEPANLCCPEEEFFTWNKLVFRKGYLNAVWEYTFVLNFWLSFVSSLGPSQVTFYTALDVSDNLLNKGVGNLRSKQKRCKSIRVRIQNKFSLLSYSSYADQYSEESKLVMVP